MSGRLLLSAVAGSLFALLAVAACQGSPTAPLGPPTATPTSAPPAAKARIEVVVNGATVLSLGARDLQGLPQRPLPGGAGRGIALQFVLDRAGVTDFASVTVVGSAREGELANSVVLTKDQLSSNVLLVLDTQGYADLLGPGAAEGQRVRGVFRIEVSDGARQAAEYSIQVTFKGQPIKTLGVADLRKLESKTFGDDQGPTLLSVLEMAGIKDFSKVTVAGLSRGRRGSLEIMFSRAEVTDGLILDFTNQGTTKLTGPVVPESHRVLDITRLAVE